MIAGEALREAAADAEAGVRGLAVYDGAPLQAAFPHATLDAGLESDWSHKSGRGREVRLALTIIDQGERPVRLRARMAEAEDALETTERAARAGWRVVTMHYLRSRTLRQPRGWAGVIEFRARMLEL